MKYTTVVCRSGGMKKQKQSCCGVGGGRGQRATHVHCVVFNGQLVEVLKLSEIGHGVVGSSVGVGPLVTVPEHGTDVVVHTVLIRDVVCEVGSINAVAIIVGKDCADVVARMVASAEAKLTLLGLRQVRVEPSAATMRGVSEDGWEFSGHMAVVTVGAVRCVDVGAGSARHDG